MMLVSVPIAQIEQGWVQALPLLKRIADSAPDLSLAGLWATLRSGAAELWLAGSAESGTSFAAVVRFEDWSGVSVAFVVGAASDDTKEWFEHFPAFKEAWKARGAEKIAFNGRLGFHRKMPEARKISMLYEVRV